MGKSSKAQLNAISRSYTQKRQSGLVKQAEDQGLKEVYGLQKTYKTLAGFLKAVECKTEQGKKALTEAKNEAERLLKCYPDGHWKRAEKTAVINTVKAKLATMPKKPAPKKTTAKPKATAKKATKPAPKKSTATAKTKTATKRKSK